MIQVKSSWLCCTIHVQAVAGLTQKGQAYVQAGSRSMMTDLQHTEVSHSLLHDTQSTLLAEFHTSDSQLHQRLHMPSC